MKKNIIIMVLASLLCAFTFAACSSKPAEPAADAANADEAKPAEAAKADDAKADEAKPAEAAKADDAKADGAKADDAAKPADVADPSIEDVCKHTASCFENSNIDQCVAMAKADDTATKCPNEFKAMQKCMVAASCDDIKADKACKAENDALLACKGNSAKE